MNNTWKLLSTEQKTKLHDRPGINFYPPEKNLLFQRDTKYRDIFMMDEKARKLYWDPYIYLNKRSRKRLPDIITWNQLISRLKKKEFNTVSNKQMLCRQALEGNSLARQVLQGIDS